MKKFRTSLLSSLFLLLTPAAASANPGAWVQDKGAWQLITTASYYSTSERFDNQGNSVAQPRYTKYEINPYIEYGLWDHTTVGANLFLQQANNSARSNLGISDAEFFARTRLWSDAHSVISVQPMIKLPGLYERRNQPKIGGDHMDVGLALIGGHSFNAFGFSNFAELELGQRARFGDPKNQYIANASIGSNVAQDWKIIAQSFNTIRAGSNAGAAFTQSSGDDYTLNKLQLSAVYKVNEQVSLQGGGYHVLDGKNTGSGEGLIFAVWTKF
jgi:hypothetical protein